MQKYKRALLVTAALILVLTCLIKLAQPMNATAAQGGDWTGFRRDLGRGGFNSGGGLANSASQLWNFSTSASVWSSPAVVDGRVFVGCKDCYIYCLNASSGDLLWSFPTGHEVNSSPAVSEGRVYFGCFDGWVYCLDIDTGMPVWIVWVGGYVFSSPMVIGGCVYIGSGFHDLVCLNAYDGNRLWTFPTSSAVNSSPAYANGVVYFACDDFHVYAVNASSGKQIWRVHTGSNMNTPCLWNGRLYVGGYDGVFWCLDTSAGAKLWKFQTGDTIVSSAAAAYGYIYVGSDDGKIYCLNATDGVKVWQTPTGYWVRSSPTVSDGNLYVGSQDYTLYCLDAYRGTVKWVYETGCNVDSSPTIVNGVLYTGSHDYHVYALTLSDYHAPPAEKKPFQVASGTVIFDLLAVTVFAATALFVLYSFHTSRKSNIKNSEPEQKQPWFKAHISGLFILVVAIFNIAYYLGLGEVPLWASDEKTYSQMAYHMFKSGDYLLPWSFGEPAVWAGKPPLQMWLMALSFQVFGVNSLAARFASPIFGALTLIVMFYLGKKLYNAQVGLLSVLVLGSFTTFYAFATHAMTDMPLMFFMLSSFYFLLHSQQEVGGVRYAVFGGVFFGLALMTKQIEALLIPLIFFVYYAATNRSVRFLFTKRFTAFWAVTTAIFLPYVAYMALRFREFWECYFVYSVFSRATTAIEGNDGGYLFYFSYLVTKENLFWVALMLPSALLCIYMAFVKRSKADALVLTWSVVVLLVFTLAQTKLYWYVLPALPAFALAISRFLYWVQGKCRFSKKAELKNQPRL